MPDEIKEVTAEKGGLLSEILVANDIAESKSDFRRLVSEGAIKKISEGNAEEKITDPTFTVTETISIKVGKHRFLKINVS